MMKFMSTLAKFFTPQPSVMLGRWRLKHNSQYCETYIMNYYGEPGYQNNLKTLWIEKIKNSEKKN